MAFRFFAGLICFRFSDGNLENKVRPRRLLRTGLCGGIVAERLIAGLICLRFRDGNLENKVRPQRLLRTGLCG